MERDYYLITTLWIMFSAWASTTGHEIVGFFSLMFAMANLVLMMRFQK